MTKRIMLTMLTILTAVVAIAMLAFLLSSSRHAAAEPVRQAAPEPTPKFAIGDAFAAVGEPYVYWYRPDGTFVMTLTTGQPGRHNAGMAFDAAGNLYVTNYHACTVTKFDTSGNLLGTFGGGYNGSPESIVFDCAGNAYVGTATGDNDIRKFNAEGTPVAQFDVDRERHGSDWIDLAADQCTMFYTSEGRRIMRYDVCTGTQLADFASLPGRQAFALRVLPDGGVLVADTEAIYRLDSTGTIVMTYTHPSETRWRNLALDPDGTSFWGGGWDSSFYRFDIATGEVLTGPITPITPTFLYFRGLAVFCEPTAASCGCADLMVAKADSPDPADNRSKLTYTIIVTNEGPTAAAEVTLTDTLPPGVIFGSVTPGQGNCSGTNNITCTLGKVASGDSVIIEIVVTPTAVTAITITNTVTVMGNAYDPDASNNMATQDTRVITSQNAVELLYFQATPQPGAVLLEWETVIEVDNYGFYLLRSASGRLEDAKEITFVPAVGYGSGGGAAYSFKDLNVQAGSTYTYWLVDLDTSGQRTVHRPVTVTAISEADLLHRVYLPLITR